MKSLSLLMLLFADLCILSVRIDDVYIIVYMYNTGIYIIITIIIIVVMHAGHICWASSCRACGWMATMVAHQIVH